MVESTARGSVISVEMKLDDSDKQESSSHVEETQIELQMSTMNLPKQDIRFTISGELNSSGLKKSGQDVSKDQPCLKEN